jgi:UDP-3-O-[3-hydroxymyristoyl] glucosamine N-acyltransferase
LNAPTHDSVALATSLQGSHEGPAVPVQWLASPAGAGPGAVVVAPDAATLAIALAGAPAVIVLPHDLPLREPPPCSAVRVDDPRLALARLSALFDRRPAGPAGVHATAVVAADASLGDDVAIGPHSVVEAGAAIGAGTRIGPNCSIGAGAVLGRYCRLHAGVALYDGVILGERVELHSGCVVGADGFGYAAGPGGATKIHHLGNVLIGDDVEIGANSSVDRGTLDPTRIGPRSKIDNHCQVGHNVTIGSDCLIAAMTAIAGSTSVGDRTILGGYVAVTDHVAIGADVRIAGRAGVTKDVPDGETWAGFPAQPYRRWVRGLYLQGRLERIWQAVKGHDAQP